MIRVSYQNKNIKYMIKDPNQTFDELKASLVIRYAKIGVKSNVVKLMLVDKDNFEYMGDEVAMDYLESN